MIRAKRLSGWSLVAVLSVGSLGAAGRDVRLVTAIKAGDRTAVQSLLKQRVDVNTPEVDGTTPLHWAVRRDDLDTAILLIGAGANVKAANRYGVTPLSVACTNGNAAMMARLLKAGADPNATLPEGETALMTAARTGKLDAVRVLLVAGAEANATEPRGGQNALMWAAAEGHVAVVKTLLEVGADPKQRSKGGFTPFLYAVREGRIDTVRAFIEAGVSPHESFTQRVNLNGETFGVRRVLDMDTVSPLLLAVRNGHFEVAAALLDAGADPNAHPAAGWTALHEIVFARNPGQGDFPINAVGSGSVDSLSLVKQLVAHGASPNERMTRQPAVRSYLNMIGATPFMLAARFGDPVLMRLLVALGADPLLTNDERTTPLMAAAGVGVFSPGEDPGTEATALEATKIAWELGGDVNAVDDLGDTAMHGAALAGLNSVVEFLIEKGARVEVWNRPNHQEWTPLQIADGVYYTNNLRAAPHTAVLLRQLLARAPSARPAVTPEPAPAVTGLTDEQQVQATLDAFARAVTKKQDLRVLRRIYHEALIARQNDTPTRGKEEAIKATSQKRMWNLEFKDTAVRVDGAGAALNAVMTEHYADGYTLAHDVQWELVKGQGPYGWQIVATQVTRRQ